MITAYISESIIARAIKEKKIAVSFYNPRDFSKKKNKQVDDKPYGGGPGMVIMVDSIACAVKRIQQKILRRKIQTKIKILITNPSGKEFTNQYADKLVSRKYSDIIIICGRYEGIDARVKKIFKAEEVSIGNYILTGGEIPAMVIIDAITRRIPLVLGNSDSIEENRISSSEMYTRPEIYKFNNKKYHVPKVLLTGNHQKIEKWREDNQSQKK